MDGLGGAAGDAVVVWFASDDYLSHLYRLKGMRGILRFHTFFIYLRRKVAVMAVLVGGRLDYVFCGSGFTEGKDGRNEVCFTHSEMIQQNTSKSDSYKVAVMIDVSSSLGAAAPRRRPPVLVTQSPNNWKRYCEGRLRQFSGSR